MAAHDQSAHDATNGTLLMDCERCEHRVSPGNLQLVSGGWVCYQCLEGPRCESGWTGDRCTFDLFHEGPHSNEYPNDQPRHTVGGKVIGPEGVPYGTTHDMLCPGCQGTSFTASPRSETYWSS